MNDAPSASGLWSLVIINSAVFISFALSFAKPQSSRDWRSFGAFSAFLVALFTEMYGFRNRPFHGVVDTVKWPVTVKHT